MLTCDIRINGSMIGYLYMVNEGVAGGDGNYKYRYEYYVCEVGVTRGWVIHERAQGMLSLLRKVIEEIMEAEKTE